MLKISILGFIILLASCGHHKDVRPGMDGTHKVFINDRNESKAHRKAMKQANHYCKDEDKRAYIVKHTKKHQGGLTGMIHEKVDPFLSARTGFEYLFKCK